MTDKLPVTNELKCPRCFSKMIQYRQRDDTHQCRRCGLRFRVEFDGTPEKRDSLTTKTKAKVKVKAKKKAKTKKR